MTTDMGRTTLRLLLLLLILTLSSCSSGKLASPRSKIRNDSVSGLCLTQTPSDDHLATFAAKMKSNVDYLVDQNRDLFELPQIPIETSTHDSPTEQTTDSIKIFFEDGDTSPSIKFPATPSQKDSLRLDPFLRRHNLHGVSRISVSPDNAQISVVALKARDELPVALIIKRSELSSRILEIPAYDTAWVNNETLYITALVNQKPQHLHCVRGDAVPKLVLTAKAPAEEILISSDTRAHVLFAQLVTPTYLSVNTFDAVKTPFTPTLALHKDLPGARCAIWKAELTCLSYASNRSGEIIRPLTKSHASIISGSPHEPIVDLDVQGDRLVAFLSSGTATTLQVIDSERSVPQVIKPLSPVTTLVPALRNGSESAPTIQKRSFTAPTTLVSLHEILEAKGFNEPLNTKAPRYQEESLLAPADDGTMIPISLVRPPSTQGLLIKSYGAYGVSTRAEYSELQQSLLAEGVAVAIVHVRGGGELGPSWHSQAKRETKARSVTDLIAAVKFLQSYLKVSPKASVATGRSAGGWLVAKAAITSSSSFGGIILDAPLLHLTRAVSDPKAPLFDRDSAEWGAMHAPMLSASPFPEYVSLPMHVFISIPMRDELIDPRETLAWALRARCQQGAGYLTAVQTLPTATHSGGLTRAQERFNEGLLHAFMRQVVFGG